MISICIAFKNDYELIDSVVKNIIDTAKSDDYEIIVYNDGSVLSSGRPRTLELNYKNTRVINASQSFGVGYAFDRAVESAKGEYLVLMGSDVYPHRGWHAKALDAVKSNLTTIGCAVCVGDKPLKDKEGNPIIRDGELVYARHYGADLLIKMDNNDLPLHSKLRERKGGYTDLFRGKWAEKRGNEPYEISCLMGAWYICHRSWYEYIGGFDTEPNNRYCGFRVWGHLEPYLSMKSYLCGGNCILFPDMENTHIFNRDHRGRGEDWMWWTALFMLETMVLSEARRNMLKDFVNPELNYGVAQKWIKQNIDTVLRYREKNQQRFKYGIEIFQNKFGCRL